MRRIFFVTLGVIIVFGLLTLATYEDNADSDAFTLIGFPFRFYVETQGKLTDPKYAADFGYFPKYLVYDILVLLLSIIVVNVIVSRFKRSK